MAGPRRAVAQAGQPAVRVPRAVRTEPLRPDAPKQEHRVWRQAHPQPGGPQPVVRRALGPQVQPELRAQPAWQALVRERQDVRRQEPREPVHPASVGRQPQELEPQALRSEGHPARPVWPPLEEPPVSPPPVEAQLPLPPWQRPRQPPLLPPTRGSACAPCPQPRCRSSWSAFSFP